MSEVKVHIALLGCGNVGRRVAELILERADEIAARTGLRLELARILVRDVNRERQLPRTLFTDRVENILADERIQLVIELLGGADPAQSHVSRLLARGVHVVTANKTLIAHHGPRLREIARRSGASLAYEASVCTAVPILAALRGLAGDRVRSIRGIVNGACNFILGAMSREGCTLEAAVGQARERGLVEPDPAADLSGRDAAEKLCILAGAMGRRVTPDQVEIRGIELITPDAIAAARRGGHVIKLLAELDEHGARVGPVLLPARDPLATIRGEDNAISVHSDLGGELFLRGKGAGPDPTASTIFGDVLGILAPLAPGSAGGATHEEFECEGAREDRPAGWFVRIPVSARLRPQGVLATLCARGVDVEQVDWRSRSAALWTRHANEHALTSAVGDLLEHDARSALIARCAPLPQGAGG